jgi:hypothetical protein
MSMNEVFKFAMNKMRYLFVNGGTIIFNFNQMLGYDEACKDNTSLQ